MKPIWKNLIALAVFIAFVVAGFVIATLVPLKGASYWILVGVFAALGLIGAGALLWWWRSQPSAAGPEAPGGQTLEREIDFLVRKAESRLRASRLGRNATVGKLPVILLAGETGSGKTSVVLDSGLESELLAGQVSQDDKTVPTRSVNLWFASPVVLAEAAGGLLTQPPAWARLVGRLAPSGVSSVFGRKGPAPRVAIVCVSCESFTRPGAAEANAGTLRALRSSLEECSRRLGINLAVYVVFTKLDQVPFFAEYVENLLPDEAAQVFGATLPALPNVGAGTYAEEETKRLTVAFDELFYGLSDGRTEFLARENKAERLPGAYEFPREFRKLRGPVVQFLVDLARPSQLTASPLLRGFYFAGRRAVLVETEAASAEVTHPGLAAPEEDMGATRVMTSAQIQRLAAQRSASPGSGATHVFDLRGMASGTGRTRQVQQPVFLTRLLSGVLLKDGAGLQASGSSSKVNLWRRLLLATAAVVFLVFCAGFIVSYLNNRALEKQVNTATQAAETSSPNAPLPDQLQQLENLRRPLAKIGNYNLNGEPASLAWWLYAGHRLYPIACSAYAGKFNQVLLGPAQSSLVSFLR
ncbi:MAG: type VI secretion protein IcmF/TssM N-terminal domain-containing protein, partial [Acetobacteraceae bacterium]